MTPDTSALSGAGDDEAVGARGSASAVSAVNHHCEHWSGFGEDASPECCICGDNPCGKVTVSVAIAHGIGALNQERAYYEGEIRYVLKHGKREELPF